jgi:hypothetical protein
MTNIRSNVFRLMILRNAIETNYREAVLWGHSFQTLKMRLNDGWDYNESNGIATKVIEPQLHRIDFEDWRIIGCWNANDTDRLCREQRIRGEFELSLYRLKRIRDENPHLRPNGCQVRFAKPIHLTVMWLRETQREQAEAEFQLRVIHMDMDMFSTYDELDWDYETWQHGVRDASDTFDPWGRRSHIGTQMRPLDDDIRFTVARYLDNPNF